ncbi:MAG: EAL domain-containing protein [Xanthobacteraceae bacterium]
MPCETLATSPRRTIFGRRRVTPHVFIVDDSAHVRSFLSAMFRDMGFVVHEAEEPAERDPAARLTFPIDAMDLAVVGVTPDSSNALTILKFLGTIGFPGKVMIIGARHSAALKDAITLSAELGLSLLPPLGTPFRAADMERRVAMLRPACLPQAPVDIEEALDNNWLELWYQPKFDAQSLTVFGAEALCRLRHPVWGVVLPAHFIPQEADAGFEQLSEFVVARAIADATSFAQDHEPIEISINLPLAALQNDYLTMLLGEHLPRRPGFRSLMVEVDSAEVLEDLALARDIARELRFHDIGLSLDNVGVNCIQFAGLDQLPFAEIKVDPQVIRACARNSGDRRICSVTLDIAKAHGLRSAASGVETHEELFTLRDLGFDVVQGFLFARPVERSHFTAFLTRRHLEAFA